METRHKRSGSGSSASASSLIDALDDAAEKDDFDWAGQRERRLEALKAELKQKEITGDGRHGHLTQMQNEKDLIETSAKEQFCLMQFFHPDFPRCGIMERHLSLLAPKYPATLFLKANVHDSPFLVARMSIKVLPCVIIFVQGNAVDRLIGFEELGNTDDFTTAVLEARLKRSGVLKKPGELFKLQAEAKKRASGDDSGDEDDELGRNGAGRRKLVSTIRTGKASSRAKDDEDEWA